MILLRLLLALLLTGGTWTAHAAPANDAQTLELTVDGTVRTALVHVPPSPPKGGAMPVVFVFHGHGGTARGALDKFMIDRLWPEAISVYPQGLNTPGILTDPEGQRAGWQKSVGDQGDRDLHFFDALLARLRRDHPVDAGRVHATGHSNGGGFTCLLWLARPQAIAAVAPCSGGAAYARQLTPKPALICAGREDRLVKFEWQQRLVEVLLQTNGCERNGQPWQDAGTLYPSASGTPLATYFYDGGHAMVPEEGPLIVRFFQEHPGPAHGALTSPPAPPRSP